MGGLSECTVDNELYHFGFIMGISLLSWGGLSERADDNERCHVGFITGTSFLSWGGVERVCS